MKRTLIFLTVLGVTLGAAAPRAQAQAAYAGFSNDWTWGVGMYLWWETISAESGQGDLILPIEITLGDAISDLDFALTAHVEAKKAAWGFWADVNYANLSSTTAESMDRSSASSTRSSHRGESRC